MIRAASLSIIAAATLAVRAADAHSTPVDDALRELQMFYRSQHTCERVRFEYRTPGAIAGAPARVARSSIVVRVSPDVPRDAPIERVGENPALAPRPGGGLLAVGLELPPLRVFAGDGRLIVVHDRDPATFFESRIPDPLTPSALGEAMPPVLLPQVDLAAAPADGGRVTAFWPYVRNIRWASADPDPRQARRRILRGVGESLPTVPPGKTEARVSPVSVTLTMQGPRLHTLSLDAAELGTRFSLAFSPVLPCDDGQSEIDVSRRTRVASIDALQPRGGTLRVGVRVPAMPLTEAAGKGWSIEALLDPPPRAALEGVGQAEHVVLVMLRSLPDEAQRELLRFDPAELARMLAPLRSESFRSPAGSPTTSDEDPLSPPARLSRFAYAPVLVMASPTPDEVLRRLKKAEQQWGGGVADTPGSGASAVLWTTEPRSTIDLFAPGAEAVVVVLDPELVLRAVITPGRNELAEHVADRIAATLFELAP